MTDEAARVAAKLTKAQREAIRESVPWGDRWWLPYTEGEEKLEELNIFRFGIAQFTDLGLAVRAHLESPQ